MLNRVGVCVRLQEKGKAVCVSICLCVLVHMLASERAHTPPVCAHPCVCVCMSKTQIRCGNVRSDVAC